MKLQRELPLTGVGDEKRLIPLGDENPREKVPVVNYAIISANLLVFLFSISSGRYGEIVMKYGFIPEKFFRGENLFTLLSSMYLHGGLAHLGFNMLYLWIFGDNIENELGHFRYLFFYHFSGIGASITHALLTGSPDIPSIGSSGAISGVIGAYFLLYPRARVYVLFFIFPFVEARAMPASLLLGIWFLFQLLFGIISVIKPLFGIAYWAHVGGFLIGLAVGTFLKLKNNERKRRKSEFHYFTGYFLLFFSIFSIMASSGFIPRTSANDRQYIITSASSSRTCSDFSSQTL